MKKYYHVYKIINLINNKIYVGRHFGTIDDKYFGSGLLLYKAIKKYGKENFRKELIEINADLLENQQRERYWIKKINSFQPNGYNINPGGDGGDNITSNPNKEKICKKISLGNKKRFINNPESYKKQGKTISGKNNPMYGKNYQSYGIVKHAKLIKGKNFIEIYGEEKANSIKQKISNSNKNKIVSVKTRNKLRLANLGIKNPSYKKIDNETVEQVLNQYENTNNAGIIAKNICISLYIVEKILKENNLCYIKTRGSVISGKNNPRYYELDQKIYEKAKKDYYENDLYLKEIQEKYGISIRKFKEKLKQEGLKLKSKNHKRKRDK